VRCVLQAVQVCRAGLLVLCCKGGFDVRAAGIPAGCLLGIPRAAADLPVLQYWPLLQAASSMSCKSASLGCSCAQTWEQLACQLLCCEKPVRQPALHVCAAGRGDSAQQQQCTDVAWPRTAPLQADTVAASTAAAYARGHRSLGPWAGQHAGRDCTPDGGCAGTVRHLALPLLPVVGGMAWWQGAAAVLRCVTGWGRHVVSLLPC